MKGRFNIETDAVIGDLYGEGMVLVRNPDGDIHFFGADAFSFGAGITLQDGDVMVVAFQGFGRPLRNPLKLEKALEKTTKELVAVTAV